MNAAINPIATPGLAGSAPSGGTGGAPSSSGAGPFARELQRASQPPNAGGNANANANAAAKTNAPRPAAREAEKPADKAARPADRDASRAEGSSRAEDEHDALHDDKDGDDDNASTPDMASLLAGLLNPHAATPAAALRGRAGAARGGDGDGAVASAGSAGSAKGAKGGPAGLADAARGTANAGTAEDPRNTLHATADAEGTLPTARPDAAAFALPNAAAPAAGNPPEAAAGAAARPVHESSIATPLHGTGFGPALGAEVSLLVRDGVQEARLALNPAEMGPITVQIQIDGNQAQVNLSAEQAPTRQALEQALPALAAALNDSGLTLSGGGVFEQAQRDSTAGRDGQPGAGPGRGGEAAEPEPVAAAAAARGSPRGVVDLYA